VAGALEGGRAIHTVEEVSERLGIPRPTLYRYLRDYGVPHVRQGGRISIPEESFDTIREARDLHREGLGTEAVRRRLAEGEAGLAERLDGISETLEELRENLGPQHGMTSHEALRTILARQTLIISAVSDLTGMVEDLLAANEGARRRRLPPGQDALAVGPAPVAPQVAADEPLPQRIATEDRVAAERRGRFGSRRRRRRWGVLGGVAVALVALIGSFALARPDAIPDALADLDWRTGAAPTSAPASPGSEEAADAGARAGDRDAAGGGSVAASRAAPDSARGGLSGATATAVPDVSGLGLGAAARRLRDDGFRVPGFLSGPGPEGEVVGTRPEAGARVEEGSPVVLVVGDGSERGGG